MHLKLLISALLFILWMQLSSQASKNLYFSPGLGIGYCIPAKGISMEINFDFGLRKTMIDDQKVNYGISVAKSWTYIYKTYKSEIHKLTTMNLMVALENIYAKLGWGVMLNPHGYGNAVRCRVPGINADVSYTQRNYAIPWIGLRSFYYNKNNWRWFDYYYFTPYVKYKYDFHGSDLKE